MKDKSLAIGSTLAAFLASLCCLGPLLLGGAGLGAVLVATFAPLRPYFLGLSAVLLAGGFYFVYRKPKAAEACAGETCAPESGTRRMAKPLLWVATLAVAALAFFPSYGVKLVGTPAAAPISSVTLQTAELKIAGMDCEVCAATIQRKLLETRGLEKAEVRYPAGSATIQFDPSQTDTEKLIAVVTSAGYKASPSRPVRE
jgi:mercuric ion transport protein